MTKQFKYKLGSTIIDAKGKSRKVLALLKKDNSGTSQFLLSSDNLNWARASKCLDVHPTNYKIQNIEKFLDKPAGWESASSNYFSTFQSSKTTQLTPVFNQIKNTGGTVEYQGNEHKILIIDQDSQEMFIQSDGGELFFKDEKKNCGSLYQGSNYFYANRVRVGTRGNWVSLGQVDGIKPKKETKKAKRATIDCISVGDFVLNNNGTATKILGIDYYDNTILVEDHIYGHTNNKSNYTTSHHTKLDPKLKDSTPASWDLIRDYSLDPNRTYLKKEKSKISIKDIQLGSSVTCRNGKVYQVVGKVEKNILIKDSSSCYTFDELVGTYDKNKNSSEYCKTLRSNSKVEWIRLNDIESINNQEKTKKEPKAQAPKDVVNNSAANIDITSFNIGDTIVLNKPLQLRLSEFSRVKVLGHNFSKNQLLLADPDDIQIKNMTLLSFSDFKNHITQIIPAPKIEKSDPIDFSIIEPGDLLQHQDGSTVRILGYNHRLKQLFLENSMGSDTVYEARNRYAENIVIDGNDKIRGEWVGYEPHMVSYRNNMRSIIKSTPSVKCVFDFQSVKLEDHLKLWNGTQVRVIGYNHNTKQLFLENNSLQSLIRKGLVSVPVSNARSLGNLGNIIIDGNDYIYGEWYYFDELQPHVEAILPKTHSPTNQILDESIQSCYRIGARKLTKATKNALIACFNSMNSKYTHVISSLLESTVGQIFVFYTLSNYLSKQSDNPKIQKILDEIKIDSVMLGQDTLFQQVLKVFQTSENKTPKTRVKNSKTQDSNLEEEYPEEMELKIQYA